MKATPEQAWGWTSVSDLGDVMFEAEMNGSNNWVIAPEKSTSGRPIMANDPHRTHSIPPLRYLAHLTAPGIDVIGAGEPVIPGVSIGHNGHSAFGLTIFYSDQEDVYLYETKSDNPDLYRHNGVWEAVESIDQTFEIAGYPAQVLPLRFTRHGPVLHEEPDNNRMFAVRTVWFEPGSAPYLKSLEAMLAKDLPT
ncbi:MAG: penicillin acylase family protein, partial [Hyphomicrobiales bacterium]|nr:penicillin acylase family protein [Hyphomicrobiales bacterium]